MRTSNFKTFALILGLSTSTLINPLFAASKKGGDSGGGGSPDQLRSAMNSVIDPLQEKEKQEQAEYKRELELYAKNKNRMDTNDEISGWAKLTLNFVKLIQYSNYPITDEVIKHLTPEEVSQTFKSILDGGNSLDGNGHFIVKDNLELDGDKVLFISHRDSGIMEVNLSYWQNLMDIDTNYLLETNSDNLKKLPSVQIIATLLHEVLVMRGLESSKQYDHSKMFSKAVQNFIENSIGVRNSASYLKDIGYFIRENSYSPDWTFGTNLCVANAVKLQGVIHEFYNNTENVRYRVDRVVTSQAFSNFPNSLHWLSGKKEEAQFLRTYREGESVPMATSFTDSHSCEW